MSNMKKLCTGGLVLLAGAIFTLSRQPAPHDDIAGRYGTLPLGFEPNHGQADGAVRFVARGRGYTLFLTPTEAVLGLRKRTSSGSMASPAVLRMQLLGANSDAAITGHSPLPGRSNYFLGNDPAKWRTNVPNFAQVAYREVYPGVDMVYYGNGGQLEHDFIVKPGASPKSIRLGFSTASRLTLDYKGDLLIGTNAETVVMRAPTIYQTIGHNKRPVAGRYAIQPGQAVGFEIDAYDASLPLIIDPVLVYSTYLGGSVDDAAGDIAVDAGGSAYIVGQSASASFPVTSPASQAALAGGNDVFVTKLSPDGSSLIYSTWLGGSDEDLGNAIAIDSSGNAYITGATSSVNFPVTPGGAVHAFQTAQGGGGDAFVAKLNSTGSALLYSTYLGGVDYDLAYGIATDSAGQAYVTGQTFSANFPIVGTSQAYRGKSEAFVTKVNAAGTALLYSIYAGSASGDDQGRGIAIDSSGNAFIAGDTTGADFPVTAGAYQPASGGGAHDAVVFKVSSTGAVLYSTYLGGSGDDRARGITLDPSGNICLSGRTDSTNFPVVNPVQGALAGGLDVFVVKLAANGTSLIFSTYMGGTAEDQGEHGIRTDAAGNVYLTGYTASPDFPLAGGPLQSSYNGGAFDAFIAKIASGGGTLLYSTYFGGNHSDYGRGLALDAAGHIYIAGQTSSTNLPVAGNPVAAASGGGFDAFAARIANASAVAALSTTSLTFAGQTINTTRGPLPVVLTNAGNQALGILEVAASGDFAQTNNCGGSLAAQANCIINITFTPSALGTRTGAVTITDSAPGSPRVIRLLGTGLAAPQPIAILSDASLTFGNQQLNIASAAQTVTLTNRGDGPLSVAGIHATSDFAQSNNCGSTVGAGTSCTIAITLTATAGGQRTGSVSVIDNAPGSPRSISLSGYSAPIRFGTWSDVQLGVPIFTQLAPQMKALNPSFTIYPGDVCNSGPNLTCLAAWKDAMNTGSSGLFDISFISRGNHDSDDVVTWVSYFNMAQVAVRTGATNYTEQSQNLTYSFDYKNAHFAALDAPGGDASTIKPELVAWLDSDLSAAEARGLRHAFIFYHGATYYVDDHIDVSPPALVTVLNRHQIVSATFNGHEHLLAYVHIDATRIPGVTHPWEQFTTAGGGMDLYNCNIARSDWCQRTWGFSTVDVDGDSFIVNMYVLGSATPVRTFAFNKAPLGLPAPSLSPTVLTFASQQVSTVSAAKTVTLTNNATGPLAISGIAATGDYAVSANTCGAAVAAGGTCSIGVTFKPTAAGTRTGTLSVTDMALGSPHTVSLNGTGASSGLPAPGLSPATLTFTSQQIGTVSAAKTLTLTNNAAAALAIAGIAATGDYAVSATTCDATVAVGAACSISVTFNPTATGVRTGTLSVTDNATASPHKVTLSGTGAALPAPGFSPAPLTFPGQQVTTISAVQTVTLTNNAAAALAIAGIAATGDYIVSETTCGATVPVSGTCSISVAFKPMLTGTRTGTLSVTDNATASPHKVTLTGTGVPLPAPGFSAATLTFSSQQIATVSAAQTVTLTNNAAAALAIASIAVTGDYLVSGNTCGAAVAVGGTCLISVTFKPTLTGTRTGTLSVTDNATASPHKVTLTGTGAPLPAPGFSAATLTFSSQQIATVSAAQTVTLANNAAGAALAITSIAASGDYTLSANTCGATVPVGGTCSISVTFKPTAAGTRTGTLSVTDNAAASPHKVTLTGTGTPLPAPGLSPPTLTFSVQQLATVSAAQTVILTNNAAGNLSIVGIAATGDYGVSGNTCGTTLASGATCTIAITFTPTVAGARSGSLAITDNASGSPHKVTITGNAIP